MTRGDTPVRADATTVWRSLGLPASGKAFSRESHKDFAVKSQERLAPQPPEAPQQQRAAMPRLAKTVDATPLRRDNKKEDNANDADIVKRMQRICKDADPTRLYRNLVKIGQG
jgi:p21-activated kinase 1